MPALRSVPEQGQLAVVRQRRYVVTDVRRGARRSRHMTELVWTGPATLSDLIRCAERRLTMTSFGIFQVPRLVEELERSLERGGALPAAIDRLIDALLESGELQWV